MLRKDGRSKNKNERERENEREQASRRNERGKEKKATVAERSGETWGAEVLKRDPPEKAD